jgi:DNA replication protein DnaC
LKDFNTTLPAIRGQIFTNRAGGDVFIFGPAGVGKTHLFAAAIRHLIYQGFECILIHFDDFLVQLRSTMSPRASLTEWEVIEPLKKIDYLFIDDLGLRTKVENDFPYVTLFSILNARQINCLPTWISSNKSIDGIGKSFDARITSRLQT